MLDLNIGWFVASVVVSLGIFGLRNWAPKAAARRLEKRGSIVGPALKPTFEQEALSRSGVDLQNVTNRRLHDDMLAEALKLKVRARSGTTEERLVTIDRAISKVADALTARPGSYEGTKLSAELHLDRALLLEGEEAVAPLELAAGLFQEASGQRLGVIDNYVGRGWCYLQMSRVDPEWAGTYAIKAAAAFSAGFGRAHQNVWVLRGWGLAIDQYARSPQPDQTELDRMQSEYEASLRIHRGGQHDLFEWFATVRRATDPTWVDVPMLRDVY